MVLFLFYFLKFYVNGPILICFLDDYNEDKNPSLHTHLFLIGSTEHKLRLVPHLPIWVHITRKAVVDLVNDPID
jgi:hypothetical protein